MNVKRIHTAWENPNWKSSKIGLPKRLGNYIAIWDMLDRSRIVRARTKEA